MKGYVYIIEFGETLIKIGKSVQPEQRVKGVSSASGRRHTRHWISPAVMDESALEARAHLAVADFRGHGEWFDCSFDMAVSKVKYLIQEEDLWMQDKEDARSAQTKLRFNALFEGIFPSMGNGKKLDIDQIYKERLKKELFERAIRNYMTFIHFNNDRDVILEQQVMKMRREAKPERGMSAEQRSELVFLRAVASEEFIEATMTTGRCFGVVTENCMMITGDVNKIPELVDVIESLAIERMAAGEPAP